MKKKLVLAVLLICLLVIPFRDANAAHTTPSGVQCDNGWRHWIERAEVNHYNTTHNSGSKVCTITHYVMGHDKECTSCHAILGYGNLQCTDWHSFCGANRKDCTTNFHE